MVRIPFREKTYVEYNESFGGAMKYLFDMGEVWHVYADVGNQWIYYRMEQVSEEMLDKNSNTLPGPLGRLEMLQQLEGTCKRLELECEKLSAELNMERKENREQYEQMCKEQKQKYEQGLEAQREMFERKYAELQKMAEELQTEGRQWRQRYLDLAYQVAPKG